MPNSDTLSQIKTLIGELGLSNRDKQNLLQAVVAENWPELPSYSTLQTPVIEEVQKATIGTGVVLTFEEDGMRNVVLMKAGTHYKGSRYEADPSKPTYMIPGGFINLTETKGTIFTPANPAKAEDPRVGAVREMEEELVNDGGSPMLSTAPDRLKPMDTKTLTFPWGEIRVVIGFMLELTAPEVQSLKAHVARLESDANYRNAVRAHTVNSETSKPEICTVSILPLTEIIDGNHRLLYPDQKSLFKKIYEHFAEVGIRPDLPKPHLVGLENT